MLDLLRVWWSFFWRYSVLFILFLLGGGIILNAFAAIWPDAKFLFLITLCYSSFPVFLNCSRESREVPEFIVPTLIEKNTNFFG